MKFSVLSSQFSVFSSELHPLNAAGLVLNGSMLLALVICITLGKRKLKTRKRTQAVTLLQAGDQCWKFSQLLSAPRLPLFPPPISASSSGFTLPPLKEGDHL